MTWSNAVKFFEAATKICAFLLFIISALIFIWPSFDRTWLSIVSPSQYYYIGRLRGEDFQFSEFGDSQIYPQITSIPNHNNRSMIDFFEVLVGTTIYNNSKDNTMMSGRAEPNRSSQILRAAGVHQCLYVKDIYFRPYFFFESDGDSVPIVDNSEAFWYQPRSSMRFVEELDVFAGTQFIASLPRECRADDRCAEFLVSRPDASTELRIAIWAEAVQVTC